MNTAKVVSVCMNIIRKSLKYSQTNFSAILAIVFCDSNRPDVRYSIFGRKDFWNQSYLDIFHSSGRKTWRSEELIIHANEPLNILPSASEYRIVLKDSSTVQDTAFFHSLAHNWKKTDQIFMKILYLYKKVSIRFESHSDIHLDPDSRSGLRILTGFALAVLSEWFCNCCCYCCRCSCG